MRRRYLPQEKLEALALVREVGIARAARRLGISPHTLTDWRASTETCAHSPYVGRGRTMSSEERERLLAQLIHEQDLEQRFMSRQYRHERRRGNVGVILAEPLDVLLTRSGICHRHLIEWLDPTFDEVAERLAA